MRSILKHLGRLVALMVAGVLAMTVMSGAPSSAATAKASKAQPAAASTSLEGRTLAKKKTSACWRKHRKCFGAVWLNSKNFKIGHANDRMTRKAAGKAARRQCGVKSGKYHKYCRSAGWVRNGCLVLVYRAKGNKVYWASGIGKTKRKAGLAARKRLKKKVSGTPKTAGYLCTTRPA